MKKGMLIKIIIIVLLVVVLGILLKLTIDAINENNNNQISNQEIQKLSGEIKDGMGMNSSNISYFASKEITEDTTIEEGEYVSEKTDENAILVTGDVDVSLENINVNKTGDLDGEDNTSFYGTNSAVLAKSGANLNVENITVNTDATGANGVFSYGGSAATNNTSNDGTNITISNSTINTKKDNSGGIMTTGGGTMKASNLTINTVGTSSAAIRTDRGGGNVTVDGGTYTTTGQGSPTIYSTANITVNNAELIAKASEGIIIEGKNSVTINICNLTDSNTKLNGKSTTYKNIFLYQSMSGDAANGNSESNGGIVTLMMTNQEVTGNIVIDSIATLDMTMKLNSYYEGTINGNNEAESISLELDETSKIKLTGDSYVTSLEDGDSSYSNIDFNGYKLYINGVAIN